MKAVSNFYTELPDAIVHQHLGNEHVLRLMHVENDYIVYRMEDFGDHESHDRRIYFANGEDGLANASLTNFFTAAGSLRHYIENGRALYYGSQPSTSRIGQKDFVTDNITLADGVELPDAIIGKLGNNYRVLYYITHDINLDTIVYQTNTSGGDYGLNVNGTTGAVTTSNVTKEFDTLQQYISNGRALYFGGTSNAGIGVTAFTGLEDTPATLSADKILKTNSTGDQIILVDDVEITSIDDIADVQTSGTGHDPADGNALVWNDSHGHWMPGEITSTFAELTDTPSTLDAGSYLRVNAAGDGVEQIKVAPPDGGLGDNSEFQAKSNFNKLPDALIFSVSGYPLVLRLRHINATLIQYVEDQTGTYAMFSNSLANLGARAGGNIGYNPYEGANASLQQIIDGGHAIYYGEKSGTSGAGSLSTIKNKSTFASDLPDAIVTVQGGGEYILRLNRITDDYFDYMHEDYGTAGTDSRWIHFTNDDVGSSRTQSDFFTGSMSDNNLQWFIENGRAIYNGGYNESNTVSARIVGSTGAVASSNYDWIESVTKTGVGTYRINFKAGHFTSIPAITVSPDHREYVAHISADYDGLSTSGVWVYARTLYQASVQGLDSVFIDSDFSIMAQHQDRPIALAAPQYGIKAWGTFDGTGSGNLSFTGGNVASVTKISPGAYRVTFTNPAPHADYSISGSANPSGYIGAYFGVQNNATTTDFTINIRYNNDANTGAGGASGDSNRISFQVAY